MTFGLQTDEATAREIIDTAASAGTNFIDTANIYPLGGDYGTVGRTEEIVGKWLKGAKRPIYSRHQGSRQNGTHSMGSGRTAEGLFFGALP